MTTNAIGTDTRVKINNHSTILIGILPIPDFLVKDANLKRTLTHRLIHKCVRIITAPLREVSMDGTLLSDMWGNLRMCHPILSNLMLDHPELMMYLGLRKSVSGPTVATTFEFGEPNRCDTRWGSLTSTQTKEIAAKYDLDDPADMMQFSYECYDAHLTGVDELVFDGWAFTEPAHAVVFDTLHFGHKFFFDHVMKWVAKAVGARELDFRFSILPRRTGWHHFREGVTNLVKTGGRDHRNMHRWVLAVAAGAIPMAMGKMLSAYIRYSNRYQRRQIGEDDLTAIDDYIRQFHEHKSIVISKGWRTSPHPYKWEIAKLELQHHIIRTILNHGELRGISTDISEALHPNTLKKKYRNTNRKEYVAQIIQGLNRDEQLDYFDLLTALTDAEVHLTPHDTPDLLSPPPKLPWMERLRTINNLCGQQRVAHVDFFAVADVMKSRAQEIPLRNLNRMRTRALTDYTAIHLKRDSDISSLTIEEAALRFNLPDLRFRIAEYYYTLRDSTLLSGTNVMQRLADRHHNAIRELEESLDFSCIKIWFSIRIQNKSLIQKGQVNPSQNLFAQPPPGQDSPRTRYTLGRYDTCLFINDTTKEFIGKADLKGKFLLFC